MDGYFNIGDMDTIITVQSVTQTIGERGQKKVTVTKYADVYAKVDRRINERVDDGNLEAGESVEVLMYKIPELTSRWRLLIDDVPYEIVSIDPISRISNLNVITARTIQK